MSQHNATTQCRKKDNSPWQGGERSAVCIEHIDPRVLPVGVRSVVRGGHHAKVVKVVTQRRDQLGEGVLISELAHSHCIAVLTTIEPLPLLLFSSLLFLFFLTLYSFFLLSSFFSSSVFSRLFLFAQKRTSSFTIFSLLVSAPQSPSAMNAASLASKLRPEAAVASKPRASICLNLRICLVG